jgi:hypothetical protein
MKRSVASVQAVGAAPTRLSPAHPGKLQRPSARRAADAHSAPPLHRRPGSSQTNLGLVAFAARPPPPPTSSAAVLVRAHALAPHAGSAAVPRFQPDLDTRRLPTRARVYGVPGRPRPAGWHRQRRGCAGCACGVVPGSGAGGTAGGFGGMRGFGAAAGPWSHDGLLGVGAPVAGRRDRGAASAQWEQRPLIEVDALGGGGCALAAGSCLRSQLPLRCASRPA